METISIKIDRSGINGLEGKADVEIITEWLKAAFGAVTEHGAEIMTHLVIRRVINKFESLPADAGSIDLTPTDLTMIRWAILSSRFPGNSNKLVSRIAGKFGIEI